MKYRVHSNDGLAVTLVSDVPPIIEHGHLVFPMGDGAAAAFAPGAWSACWHVPSVGAEPEQQAA